MSTADIIILVLTFVGSFGWAMREIQYIPAFLPDTWQVKLIAGYIGWAILRFVLVLYALVYINNSVMS